MKKDLENDIDISVIVPVYNVKNTLSRAVESILKQEAVNIEIILVDDGSTDGSQHICDNLSMSNSNIRVVHKKNGGLSSARNAGIILAKGRFITFIDSDDFYVNNFFAFAIRQLDALDAEILTFGLQKGALEKSKKLTSGYLVTKKKEEAIKRLFLDKSIDFYAWNKIYKKELFDNIRYPEGHLYEDIIPTYKLFKKADKVIITDILGIFYYFNSESIVNQTFNSAQYDNVLQRIMLLKYIEKEFPNLKPLALDKLNDGFLSTGFKISCSEKPYRIKELAKIRNDIRLYFKEILSSDNISISKKIGLVLLLTNILLYNKIYSKVLNK